jgi:hypothetical protein
MKLYSLRTKEFREDCQKVPRQQDEDEDEDISYIFLIHFTPSISFITSDLRPKYTS